MGHVCDAAAKQGDIEFSRAGGDEVPNQKRTMPFSRPHFSYLVKRSHFLPCSPGHKQFKVWAKMAHSKTITELWPKGSRGRKTEKVEEAPGPGKVLEATDYPQDGNRKSQRLNYFSKGFLKHGLLR